MIFVEPKVTPILEGNPIKVIEQAYRICYKSEANMKEGSEQLISRLLHNVEKGKNIHSSPLEHRRILVSASYEVADGVAAWQCNRGTNFISMWPQKTPSKDEHEIVLEGNFRAFFDLVKEYEDAEDASEATEHIRRAQIIINNELHKFFPVIFKYIEPWDDTDDAIDWDGAVYIGEANDYMSFHVVTTRDILQEIARNRTISPNVESTRYCNYNKKGMVFCYPRPYEWADELDPPPTYMKYDTPLKTISEATRMSDLFGLMTVVSEMCYNRALELGAKPQEARMMLIGGLKTEMILTGRYSDWAHFLKLRNDPDAHPQMVYIAKQIEDWFTNNGVPDIRKFDLY